MSWKDKYDELPPNDAGSIGQDTKAKEQAYDQTTEIRRRHDDR